MWELVPEDEIIDEVEVVDDALPAKASSKARPAADGTKESRTTQSRKPLRAEVEDDEDDRRPADKKKRKKRRSATVSAVDPDQEDRDRALREYEYVWPGILLVAGFIMCAVGAFGVSDGVSAVVTLVVMFVGLIITVPASIVALMVIGILLGIEYGRLLPAMLKIAAISFVVNGIYFICAWIGVPFFVTPMIGCAIGFGLFMTQFDLDTWETNASVGALNVMTFIANMIMVAFLVVASAAASGEGGGDYDEYDDEPPAQFKKGEQGRPQPGFDPDSDFGDGWGDEP